MNLKINLTDELEALLRARAAKEGIPVESFVVLAVAERLADWNPDKSPVSIGDFSEWLHRCSSRFPKLDQPVDDSRESIYSGRGE